VSGPARDDWDDRRLEAAFQARFDRPVPPHLRERIVDEIEASIAPPPLLRSFRTITRTAIAAIAILVAVIATMTIGGIGPTVPPRPSANAPVTGLPTTPPLIGNVGAPFPSSVRPSGSDATYAVLSVADAAAIRDRGVDDREIAVAGWFVPPQPVPCPLAPGEFQPLEDCSLNTSWLLSQPGLENPGGRFATPFGPSLEPVTDWRPIATTPVETAVVFVGHFDDARSVQCAAGDHRQRCQDRFVVDTVAWDDDAPLSDFPIDAAGLSVISVGDAIAYRESDLTAELAVAGWFQAPPVIYCAFIPEPGIPFLEGGCTTPRTWFMEAPETTNGTRIAGSDPRGPAFNPVFPSVSPPAGPPESSNGASTPTKAILIGHFNDSRASLCSRDAPQTCLGRFVVDAVPWVEGLDRPLPERTDTRAAGAPRSPLDLFQIINRVASIQQVLNVAAVSPGDLVRLWPAFDLNAASHSKGDSFWIVSVISDARRDGAVSTYIVDSAGSLFEVTGNTFAVLDLASPQPS
jgi:hypothetical protein